MIDREDIEIFENIAENAGIELQGYSGRGMYGRECYAISVQDGTAYEMIADLLEACCGDLENCEILATFLRNAREDSLGRGSIVYFPSAAWIEDDEEEGDEEEDDEEEDED